MAAQLERQGMSEPEVLRIYRTFNAASEAFRRESERHEPEHHGARGGPA
jgi:hypothetical protein